jgi:site-specific DNA recombinase
MDSQSKAVILARVSSKSQEDEGYSLDSQVKLLQSYCQNKGFLLAETFKVTESASKTSQRRIFKEAMKFIEDHKIKHLIIEKVDRHVRNLHDAVETHDWLTADEDRHVHFVKDSLVMHKNSRSQEWLNWGIRVVMAKNYIDNLREEAMKGWAEKLAQGWLPAPPPPGYVTITQNGKRIHAIDPAVADLMRRVFKLYLDPDQTIATIAKHMRILGIRTRKGRPYYKSKVQRILNNPFYIGINHFSGKDYPGAQEPLISKQLFDDVQRKMHGHRPQTYGKHNSPLKGLIRCEDCGSIVTWQRQKDVYYGVCRRLTEACKKAQMLRQDRVEAMIQEKLAELVCPSPEVIEWVIRAVRAQNQTTIDSHERLIASLQQQIDRISRMDDILYDDKLSGEITPSKYKEKHDIFVVQKAELLTQLDSVDKTTSHRLERKFAILELSQNAAQIYAQKAPEQKRLIISKLFSKLTLKEGILSVSYTDFAQALSEKVFETRNVMEDAK